MPSWLSTVATMLFATLALTSCERSDAQRIVITGSSTVAPLASELARGYERTHPGVRVDVQTGGSSRGVADARDGSAHLGMVSRGLRADESDLTAHPIAQDGIAVVLHTQNPIKQLSTDQIGAIYRGDVQRWSELGGADAEIVVVNKAEGRSTLELFLKHFSLRNSEIEADVIIGDNEQGVKTVTSNAAAIGYLSIGTAEYAVASGQPMVLLPLDGVAATSDNVRTGKYPLARPLQFVTRDAPQGHVAEFIAYAQSREASDIVGAQYFVPLSN